MSDYREIKGTNIEVVTSDPSNLVDGQIWFNSTSNKIKLNKITTTGSWATGAPLGTQRNGSGGAGIQTAALCMGGSTGPPVRSALTEHYDGSSWTAGGNLSVARNQTRGCGVETAALLVNGFAPPSTNSVEEYNGSSWTAGGNYPSAVRTLGMTGTQTAALGFGGRGWVNTTFEYNGSSWTAGGNYPAPVDRIGGAGTQTAGLGWGGWSPALPGRYDTSNHYDGSAWTSGGTLVNAFHNMACSGTQTAALSAGGQHSPPSDYKTYVYDGSAWTTDTDMPQPFVSGQGAQNSPSTAAAVFGGNSTTPNCFEFTGAGSIVETVTSS